MGVGSQNLVSVPKVPKLLKFRKIVPNTDILPVLNVQRENFCLLISDAASYMIKAGKKPLQSELPYTVKYCRIAAAYLGKKVKILENLGVRLICGTFRTWG